MQQHQLSHRPHWINILFLTLTPLASLILVPIFIYQNGLSWVHLVFLAVAYVISNMSITCGYHRYFSHRSYDVHPLIEFLYVMVGAGAFQGSILQWCTDHRRHHREVDTNDDPYSISKGFWYAHMGWMLTKDNHPESGTYAKDLEKKFWIRMQHRHYGLIATLVGFALPALIGWAIGIGAWAGFLFGGLLRVVISQHSTFFINSLCHTWGRQPYTDRNSARDSFLMAVCTFGEGYHNYHHYFQADYRNGIRWYHFDPTKWWIRCLALVGLARRLKRAQKEEILKARLAMEERLMLSRGACADRIGQLKTRIFEAQLKMRHLREEYLRAKRAVPRWTRNQMRAEFQMAKLEFRAAYGQWRVFHRAIRRMAAA